MASSAPRLARGGVAALAATALTLQGCTTQEMRIGGDTADVCRPQRVSLDSTGNYYGEDIAKGAVIGALGGALLGYLAGGNAQGAAIGAAAGAALGAAGGYWSALQQQQRDEAGIRQTILRDVNNENGQIDKTQLAFDQLVACRRGEADGVKAELKAGRIDRSQAEQAMAKIRAKYSEDNTIARRIEANIQQRSANFEFANEQFNPQTYYVIKQTQVYVQTAQGYQVAGEVGPGRNFQGSRANDQYVSVLGSNNQVAYVSSDAVSLVPPPAASPTAPSAPASQGQASAPSAPVGQVRSAAPPKAPAKAPEVQQAVSTNLAKRAAFANSIQTAERQSNAFELGESG